MTKMLTVDPLEEGPPMERMRVESTAMPGIRSTEAQDACLRALDGTVCDQAIGVQCR